MSLRRLSARGGERQDGVEEAQTPSMQTTTTASGRSSAHGGERQDHIESQAPIMQKTAPSSMRSSAQTGQRQDRAEFRIPTTSSSSTHSGERQDHVEFRLPTMQGETASLSPSSAHSGARQNQEGGALRRTQTGLSRHLTDLAFTLSAHAQPQKPVSEAPGPLESVKNIFFYSRLNLFLVCIPISWVLHSAKPDEYVLIFVSSLLGIISLAKNISLVTEELSMRTGQTIAGLLHATLGNSVELIIAIISLVKCRLHVVQSSLVGTVLSNLLLVLGTCFFAGGTKFSQQGFGVGAAKVNSALLNISVFSILLPTTFHFVLTGDNVNGSDQQTGPDILRVSRGVAVVLLLVYLFYLIFLLFSHKQIYADSHTDVLKSIKYAPRSRHQPRDGELSAIASEDGIGETSAHSFQFSELDRDAQREEGEEEEETVTDIFLTSDSDRDAQREEDEEEEEEVPLLSVKMSLVLLIIATGLVAVTAEFLVDSVDGLTASGEASKEFVGVIVLALVGNNTAVHVTAVLGSIKDKLTLSIGTAVGSSIQITLFVIPLMIILGWILDKPLTLLFDPLESVTLFLSVMTMNSVVVNSGSNWLGGIILVYLYVILAIIFWFYTGVAYQYACT